MARIRLPFFLIPGDLIVAAPILAIASLPLLKVMAIRAARGGLIPWQMVMNSRIGSFQFVIGREFGISWHGYLGKQNVFFHQTHPDEGYSIEYHPVLIKSIILDFPILDYRPVRIFANKVAASILFQLGFSVDIVTDAEIQKTEGNDDFIADNGGQLKLDPSFIFYLRLGFDGRLYM